MWLDHVRPRGRTPGSDAEILKAQLHGSQFWRQFFLKSASRFQYSNLIGCVHANYDVIVNILGVRYLENRRTRFRATAPLITMHSWCSFAFLLTMSMDSI